MAMLSHGSQPTTSGPRLSIKISVGRATSGNWVIASPQPTVPSSASTRQNVRYRLLLLSFGSGYDTDMGVTLRTLIAHSPHSSQSIPTRDRDWCASHAVTGGQLHGALKRGRGHHEGSRRWRIQYFSGLPYCVRASA